MALLLAMNTACYSFVPMAAGVAPKVGESVKVRLNAEGTTNLAQFLGPRVEYAEGLLSDVQPDGSVVVGVNSIRLLDGIDQFWSGQSVVTFPSKYVAELQRKTLDGRKTRMAAIGGALAIVAIFAIAISAGGAHGAPDSGVAPPPP